MNMTIRRIITQLTADRKKLSVMLGLLAVGLLLWGRVLLKEVPRTALADDQTGATAAATQSDGSRPGSVMRPVVYVDLPQTVQRDLFALDQRLRPRTQAATIVTRSPEKSQVKPTDEVDAAEVVRLASAGLVLQSTMLGDHPRALISGQLVRPGEKVKGFELIRVMQRSVILEMSGIRIELEM